MIYHDISIVYGVYKPINITFFFGHHIVEMSSHLEQWKFRRALPWKIYHRNALEQMRSPQRTNSEIGRFQHVARGFLLISVFSSPSARTKWTVSETKSRSAGHRRSRLHLQRCPVCPGCKSKSSNPASADCGVRPSPRISWDCHSGWCWVACDWPVKRVPSGHQISMMLLFNHLKFSYLFIPTSSKNIWNKLGSSNDFPSFPGEIHGTIRKSFSNQLVQTPWIISLGPRSCDSSRCPWLETSKGTGGLHHEQLNNWDLCFMISHDLSNWYKPLKHRGCKQGKLARSWDFSVVANFANTGSRLGLIWVSLRNTPIKCGLHVAKILGIEMDWTNENEDHPTSIGVFCDHHWFPSEMTKLPTRWYLGAPHCLGYPQILSSCCPWVLKKTRWVPAKYPSYPIIPAKKTARF